MCELAQESDCIEFPCLLSSRFERRTYCIWNLYNHRLPNLNLFLSSYNLYEHSHTTCMQNQTGEFKMLVAGCIFDSAVELAGKCSSSQTQEAYIKLLCHLASCEWLELKRVGELNVAAFFFSSWFSHWVLKYSGAATGSLRGYSPFAGNYIFQLRCSSTLSVFLQHQRGRYESLRPSPCCSRLIYIPFMMDWIVFYGIAICPVVLVPVLHSSLLPLSLVESLRFFRITSLNDSWFKSRQALQSSAEPLLPPN